MVKHTGHNILFLQKSLSFIEFWGFISSQVGDHRLDINPGAKTNNELFTQNSVHPEHLKNLVLNSISKNHKAVKHSNLDQAIDLNKLLDALGNTAFALRQNAADDLFDIELLEEIAWHIAEQFLHLLSMPSTHSKLEKENLSVSSNVVSIAKFKAKNSN